ncbi:MAG: aspartate/glutamate racemase family protein [Desulfocapsaceae bacterium]
MSLVGVIHTTRLVIEPVHQSIAATGQDLQINHVLDEGILRRLATLGRITPEIIDWLTQMVASTQDIGAELAVVSCSSLSPCVNEVRERLQIPVLKVDEPMMDYAVQHADRIGLVMTNPTTEAPSQQLFAEVTRKSGRRATLLTELCPGAFAKLSGGDIEGHDAEVAEVIERLIDKVDLIMLAQISIARVRTHLDKDSAARVLSSLDFIGDKVSAIIDTP